MAEITAEDRAVGALLGLAAGDVVGTTLEFEAPGTFEPRRIVPTSVSLSARV